MTLRKVAIIAGVLAGVTLVGALVALERPFAGSGRGTHPPSLAGQAAPDTVIHIDFDKRYDLHCALLDRELKVYRKCKIIGFTGGDKAGKGDSSGYGRSSGSYFDAWLVLELPDGRRAYLPPNSVRFIEEAPGD